VAGNGKLTSETCGAAEEDDIDSEDREVEGETPHKRAPQLHRKEEDIRKPLAGDDHHRKKSSSMSGNRRWRDLAWKAEQWSSSDETWGKRFMRFRGVSMREELTNGYRSRWLASGEGQR
jgi:hypothetical protein